jgi:hypothetical protein
MSQQQHTTPVEYREIPRYVGYRFGSDGSYWSRWDSHGRLTDHWAKRDGCIDSYGYVVVSPKDAELGQKKRSRLHRLILEAFRGPCPPGLRGCHNDDDPENNYIANLRWGTPASNSADMVRHGHSARGERNGRVKLKENDIPTIFRLWRAGYTMGRIAKMYGTSISNICFIINRKTWSHVQV